MICSNNFGLKNLSELTTRIREIRCLIEDPKSSDALKSQLRDLLGKLMVAHKEETKREEGAALEAAEAAKQAALEAAKREAAYAIRQLARPTCEETDPVHMPALQPMNTCFNCKHACGISCPDCESKNN
jgi:hypothetical protein